MAMFLLLAQTGVLVNVFLRIAGHLFLGYDLCLSGPWPVMKYSPECVVCVY